MNDDQLRKALGALRPPMPGEVERDRALYQATLALAQPRKAQESERSWLPRATWAVLGCLAVTLVVGGLAFRDKPVASAEAIATAGDDLHTLSQVARLFPGQVNAVIERDGAVQLDLAHDQAPAADAQPLVVQLESGGDRLRVLSYSGRSITLKVKGATLVFEVLVTGEGTVVLSGDNFVWSSAQPGLLAGYKVQAHTLVSSL
ncbi:MAG: hypothetical protein WC661_00030 [Opitutaceae bacterium]|jgi:hypothetical protein